MAHTGSFPLADPVGTPGRAPWTGGTNHATARTVGLALAGVFALGSAVAAVGISYQAEGYGALSIAAGGLIGIASAVPLWMLLRAPLARTRS